MAKQKESNTQEEKVEVPSYTSVEWHDYAMGFFEDFELVEGNPTTAGLRRVAELLLGPIIYSKPVKTYPVLDDKLGRATVVYEVQIQFSDGTIRTFGDIADAWVGNTDDMFVVHAPATASTRAEGRTLRKALKLRGLVAEELSNKDASKHIANEEKLGEAHEKIVRDQINYINARCKKLDVDVMKFVNSGDKTYVSIYQVTKETAIKMVNRLKEFMKDESLIPEDIRGYNAEWAGDKK